MDQRIKLGENVAYSWGLNNKDNNNNNSNKIFNKVGWKVVSKIVGHTSSDHESLVQMWDI